MGPVLKPAFLLTGFGPFPGVSMNVSGMFAEALAELGRRNFAKMQFIAATLPTAWHEGPVRLEELYRAYRPMFAMHFGVSHRARSLTVECRAQNRAEHRDCYGHRPDMARLSADGPSERMVTIPAGRIIARLKRQAIPSVLSHDAGNYLCNAILYRPLELMNALRPDGQCGFIHLPAKLAWCGDSCCHKPGADGLSFEMSLKGGLEILAVLLQSSPQMSWPVQHKLLQEMRARRSGFARQLPAHSKPFYSS